MKSVAVSDSAFVELDKCAQREGTTVDAILERAVKAFLGRTQGSVVRPPDWEERWDRVVAAFQAGVPEGMTADEIQQEVNEELELARQERIARRHLSQPAH